MNLKLIQMVFGQMGAQIIKDCKHQKGLIPTMTGVFMATTLAIVFPIYTLLTSADINLVTHRDRTYLPHDSKPDPTFFHPVPEHIRRPTKGRPPITTEIGPLIRP